MLRELSDRKHHAFQSRMCGRTLSAVTLSGSTALSSNFLKIALAIPRESNRLVDLQISHIDGAALRERELLPGIV